MITNDIKLRMIDAKAGVNKLEFTAKYAPIEGPVKNNNSIIH